MRELGMLVATLLVAGACGASREAVGVSTAHGGRGAAEPVDAGAPRPLFDPNVRASLASFGRGSETSGHAPGFYSYELFANQAARGAIDAGARAFPPGSVLGIDHARRSDGAKGPSFFMEKRGVSGERFGGWRFIAVDSEGHVVDQGALEGCGFCHRDAPGDYVFPALAAVRSADGGAP